jgi:hypothetical protein
MFEKNVKLTQAEPLLIGDVVLRKEAREDQLQTGCGKPFPHLTFLGALLVESHVELVLPDWGAKAYSTTYHKISQTNKYKQMQLLKMEPNTQNTHRKHNTREARFFSLLKPHTSFAKASSGSSMRPMQDLPTAVAASIRSSFSIRGKRPNHERSRKKRT